MGSLKKEMVVSDPLIELVGGGKNAKYVRDCFELHLGRKGIEKLAGFSRLVNLEVLDVSRNKLTYISGLENNFRLKRLYLNDNKLFTLRGPSLQNMRFIEFLEVSNNNLRDLSKVLNLLQHMRVLQQLELVGNPCCEEPDYRYHVINKLPSLHILDSHEVTDAERQHTKELFGHVVKNTTVAFMKRAPEKPPPCPPMPLGGSISQLESELNDQIDNIKAQRESEKIPEITEVLGLSMEQATVGKERRRTLPPPPGWSWPDEKRTARAENAHKMYNPEKMSGVPGRPRARDFADLTHYEQRLNDTDKDWKLPKDHDPDFEPTITLNQLKYTKLKERKRLEEPASGHVYRMPL